MAGWKREYILQFLCSTQKIRKGESGVITGLLITKNEITPYAETLAPTLVSPTPTHGFIDESPFTIQEMTQYTVKKITPCPATLTPTFISPHLHMILSMKVT